MIDGINIINTISKTEYNIVCLILVVFCAASELTFIVFSDYFTSLYKEVKLLIHIILIALTLSTTIVTLMTGKDIDNYQYQVTIDDSVKFNEFNEKYEIVDKQDNLYTIKLKE